MTATEVPDGVEVVRSAAEGRALPLPPLLLVDEVTRYLDEQGLGNGPLAWERIGEGQSNITYRIHRGGGSVVLRRGPRPPLPPSTHDMVREARIQTVLAAHGVPVPRVLAIHESPDLLGVPFYVMEHVEGEVLTDDAPAAWAAPEARRAIGDRALDALVDLHAVDVASESVARFGRPDGYLERQVRRFASMMAEVTTRDLPEAARIGELLAGRLPRTQRAAVVHGDYRLGNLLLTGREPRVAAVLDWEMATLGDPLADLGYLSATWADPDLPPTVMELTPVTRRDGFPRRADLAERYASATGLDVAGLAWYEALAMFKSAVFCEAIHTRWLRGERPGDAFGPALEQGVPALLDRASHHVAAL